jgi:hypothetical protein
MTINECILNEADKTIKQIKDETFVGGHNGPYDDEETPIRVAAHWIIIFSYLYTKYSDNKYRQSIERLGILIKESQKSSTNNAFEVRNKEGKDKINGLIGQAWIIEGLIEVAKVLDDDTYYELACNAFFQQVFDDKRGIWNRVEINGEMLGYDKTYNHQLWFAAAGSLIVNYRKNQEIEEKIKRFLDKSNELMLVKKDGLICHYMYTCNSLFKHLHYNIELLKDFFHIKSIRYKEEGYHYFNMYAFTLLYKEYPHHSFFYSKTFLTALQYTLNFDKLKILENVHGITPNSKCNIYSYGYNSPAFELPYILKHFAPDNYNESLEVLWQKQIELTYDKKNRSFSLNTNDKITLTARLYELVRAL